MKKGQSALEYLVTYGWAILAIVIIAALLVASGVFNPGAIAGSKQCSGLTSFDCQDFNANASGLTMFLRNKAGNSLTVTTVGGAAAACTPSATVANGAAIQCLYAGFTAGTTGATLDATNVAVAFTDSKSGLAHTETAVVRGKYE
ncbi:MAG: hypothetical protein WC792_00590 [Candidatus Micrarchaeia archaeon]|jgi:hypothetical protein